MNENMGPIWLLPPWYAPLCHHPLRRGPYRVPVHYLRDPPQSLRVDGNVSGLNPAARCGKLTTSQARLVGGPRSD